MADNEKKYSDIDLSKYLSGFQGSNALTQAGTKKQNAENAYKSFANKGFSSEKQGLADNVLNQYLNRDPFSYDFNADALYQQYKDKYIQQGKMAMQDTMGQAVAMTGGYGNSYAATVGNQAYQANLQNLNDVIPELYQLAYDKYNQDGQNMLNKYSLLGDAIDREYGMWGDQLSRLMADRDYYGQEESNLYNREYNSWNDNRNYDTTQHWKETNYGYGKEQDAIKNTQWQKEYDSVTFDNGGYDTDAIRRAQNYIGVDPDGMWGSQSAAKAKANGYNSLEDVMVALGIKPSAGGTPTYGSIVDDCNDYIASGASRSEISSYLRSAWQAGYITQEEYNKLRETFVPTGGGVHYTY